MARKVRRFRSKRYVSTGGGALERFPGDPGVGNYYVGWDETSHAQFDISGNPLSNLDAGAYWNNRPLAVYHSYAGFNAPSMSNIDDAIAINAVASHTFKMSTAHTPSQITAGAANAALTTAANGCNARAPWPIWMCYYHEPEENFPTSQTATEYRAAYRYIVQWFRNTGVTNVTWFPILMCPWTFGGSGRDWRWWHPDWNGGTTNTSADWHSDRMMDLFGIDVYNAGIGSTTYDDWNTDIINVMTTAVNGKGFGTIPPIVIPEFGMSADTSPWPGTLWSSDYGTDVKNWAKAGNGVGISYFNGNDATPSRYDFQPASDSGGHKLAGWRTITAAATNYPPDLSGGSGGMTFVGSDAAGGNVVTLTGIDWPSGIQSGDTAVLLWTGSITANLTAPTGFTLQDSNTGANPHSRLYTKVCTGAESGQLPLTVDNQSRQSAVLWVGRGFHATTPVDGNSKFVESVSQTTHDAPSYTLVNANCGVLTLISERSTTGTNDYTPPTGFDSNHADSLGLGVGSGGCITAVASDDLSTVRAASTVVNPGNWTSANAFSTNNVVVYTLALRPA